MKSRAPVTSITVSRPGPPRSFIDNDMGGSRAPMALQNVANGAHVRIQNLRRQNLPSPPPQTVPGVLFEGRIDPSARVYRDTGSYQDDSPSRVGATIASLAGARRANAGLRASGFRGLGATEGSRACESKGAHAAQAILGVTGGVLATLGQSGFRRETATSGGVVGSNISSDAQRNLQIAGASVNIATSLYTNICDARTDARTGTVGSGTASQTALDWRNVSQGLVQQIQATQRAGASADTPTVTTPPGETVQPAAPPNTTQSGSNTWMYVAGGVAVLAVIGLVVLK